MGLFNNNEEKLNKLLEELGSLNAKVDLMTNKLDSLSSTNPTKEFIDSKHNDSNNKDSDIVVVSNKGTEKYPTVVSIAEVYPYAVNTLYRHIKNNKGVRVINIDEIGKSINNPYGGKPVPINVYKNGIFYKSFRSKKQAYTFLGVSKPTFNSHIKVDKDEHYVNLEDFPVEDNSHHPAVNFK